MYVVALTRWGKPLEAELTALAADLNEQPYDLRMKLAGALPAYVFRGADLARTQSVLAVLQRRGHGAVALDLEHVGDSAGMFAPRRLRFDADRVWMEQGVTPMELPYGELLALVHAMHTRSTDATHVTQESKLSLGRAALTGGLQWNKTKTVETSQQTDDAEQVLYLFRHSGADPVLLRQTAIRPEGLAGSDARTTLELFRAVTDELRRRAPRALYDNRLLTNKRKATLASHTANSKSTITSHANASDTDLAAHIIALAHLKGQL